VVARPSTISDPAKLYRVEKLRFGPGQDRNTIVVNAHLTLTDIPERAYEYIVNGRPAIEWVMDRYQLRVDRDSGIRNDQHLLRGSPVHRRPTAARAYGEPKDA
jgi:predicted helicase